MGVSCDMLFKREEFLMLGNFQHDGQLDYYGKRLAICSSDRTVKVFDVVDGEAQRTGGGHTLKGYAFKLFR